MAGKRTLALVDTRRDEDADTAADAESERPLGLLHNAHDVDRLQEECQALCNAMAQAGAVVDMPRVEASAGVFALLRLLVLKGVRADAEAEGERFTAMRSILRKGLQQVEVEAAKRGKPKVEAVRAPKLVVARH